MPTSNKDSLLQNWKTKTGKKAEAEPASEVQNYRGSIWFSFSLQTRWLPTTKEVPTSGNVGQPESSPCPGHYAAYLHGVPCAGPEARPPAWGRFFPGAFSPSLLCSLAWFLPSLPAACRSISPSRFG